MEVKSVVVAFVASLAFFTGHASVLADKRVENGSALPSFEGLVDAEKKPISLTPKGGRVLVITFGASWCPPCAKELPVLNKLATDYEKNKSPVEFVAINVDQNPKTGAAFMAGLAVQKLRVVFDPKHRVVARFDPPNMPTTYIASGNNVVAFHEGYKKGDMAVLKKTIDGAVRAAKK